MSERSSGNADRDRLNQRLYEKDQDPEREEDENHARVNCQYCDDEHLGELFSSPPDGMYVRYYCPEEEMRGQRSFA